MLSTSLMYDAVGLCSGSTNSCLTG